MSKFWFVPFLFIHSTFIKYVYVLDAQNIDINRKFYAFCSNNSFLRKIMHVYNHNAREEKYKASTDIIVGQNRGIILGRGSSEKFPERSHFWRLKNELTNICAVCTLPHGILIICLFVSLIYYLSFFRVRGTVLPTFMGFFFLIPWTVPRMGSVNVYWMNNFINN